MVVIQVDTRMIFHANIDHPIKIEIDPEAEKRIEWVNFSGHHVRLLKLVRLEIEKRRFIK